MCPSLLQGTNFALRPSGLPGRRAAAAGLGDIRALARGTILDPREFPVGLAVVLEVRLPGDGAASSGSGGVLLAPRLAVERAFGPVRVLGNVGLRLRPQHASTSTSTWATR